MQRPPKTSENHGNDCNTTKHSHKYSLLYTFLSILNKRTHTSLKETLRELKNKFNPKRKIFKMFLIREIKKQGGILLIQGSSLLLPLSATNVGQSALLYFFLVQPNSNTGYHSRKRFSIQEVKKALFDMSQPRLLAQIQAPFFFLSRSIGVLYGGGCLRHV